MNNCRIKFNGEYFVFLLPLFFVLHGYTENFHLIHEKDSFLLLLKYWTVSILLITFFFLFFKSWRKAAVFVLLLMLFYFFFGSIHDSAKSILGKSFFVEYSFILPLSFVLVILLFLFFRNTLKEFNRFNQYMNFLFVILIAIDAVELIFKNVKSSDKTHLVPSGFSKCDSCVKPDIYFIIADEYAGKKELKDIFHFDNFAFENKLKQRGFFIVDSSFSNYNYTPFSIASVFSLDYLKGIKGRNQSKADRHICYDLINQNKVIDFLNTEGYSFKNYSVFEFNNQLPLMHSSFVLTGTELLTAQTFLSRIDRDIRFNFTTKYHLKSEIKKIADDQAKSVEYLYNKTKQEPGYPSFKPRFIYTHLMMPHYPYLFDKNGRRTNPELALEGNQTNQQAYLNYLLYANEKYLELIDEILKKSKKPPVIILMGDHGFRHFIKDTDHSYYFMNLNAVYLPNKKYQSFYKGMSTVNELRVLLNTVFQQHLVLLKDSTSFLTE